MDLRAEVLPQRLDRPHYLLLAEPLQLVTHRDLRAPGQLFLELRQRQQVLHPVLLCAAVEGHALVPECQVVDREELEPEVRVDPANQPLALHLELQRLVEHLPLPLHLTVDLTADVLVGTDYRLAAAALAHLLVRKHEGLGHQLQEGDRDGHAQQDDRELGGHLLLADLGDEDADGGGGERGEALLHAVGIDLHLQHHLVRLGLLLEGHRLGLEHREELLEDEAVLVLDDLADGLGSEGVLVALDHFDEPLDLLLVLLAYFLVGLDLELEALGLVDPVDALAPGRVVLQLLEDLLELALGRGHVLLLRVDDQVVVLGEDGDEGGALLLAAPGQLLEEGEELVFIDGIAFGEAADIDNGMQGDVIGLELLEDLLADDCAVVELVEAGDVEDAEADLLACHLEGGSLVVVHLSGDLLETIGHLDGGVAGEELGGRALARTRTSDYQEIVVSDQLHAFKYSSFQPALQSELCVILPIIVVYDRRQTQQIKMTGKQNHQHFL